MSAKTYLIIGGSGLALVAGYFGFKTIQETLKQRAAARAIARGGNIALGINVPDIAKQIGIELGFAYPSWDPRRWTENDTAAKILVLKVPKPLIPKLSKEYSRFYPGRVLQDDLRKTLAGWPDVRYLFV